MGRETPTNGPFTVLPQDCWVDIVQYHSFEDLLSLSTTCKDLRASTEHFLYRQISWRFGETLPLRRLLRLLRTILDRPDMASSTQLLSLLSSKSKWITPLKDIDWREEAPSFQDVTEKAIGVIKRAGFTDAEEWINALKKGNFFAFAAILISQLANIKTLHLDFSFVWLDGFPGRMMKHVVFSQNKELPTFSSLQEVDYGGNVPNPVKYWTEIDDGPPDRFSDPYNHAQFIGWFGLPSLRHLEIWLRDIEELKEKPELDFNHLHTLILARSTISETDVPFLLHRTGALMNLHLGLAHKWEEQMFYEHSDCLAEGLGLVSSTVERLSVGLEYHPCYCGESHGDDEMEEWRNPLHGILTRFTRLQVAEVPITFLLGFNPDYAANLDGSVLPDTLRELVLRNDLVNLAGFEWYDGDILDFIKKFLTHSRHSTPLLRKIKCRRWKRKYSEDWPEEGFQMQLVCKDIGIDFNIVVDRLSSGLWNEQK